METGSSRRVGVVVTPKPPESMIRGVISIRSNRSRSTRCSNSQCKIRARNRIDSPERLPRSMERRVCHANGAISSPDHPKSIFQHLTIARFNPENRLRSTRRPRITRKAAADRARHLDQMFRISHSINRGVAIEDVGRSRRARSKGPRDRCARRGFSAQRRRSTLANATIDRLVLIQSVSISAVRKYRFTVLFFDYFGNDRSLKATLQFENTHSDHTEYAEFFPDRLAPSSRNRADDTPGRPAPFPHDPISSTTTFSLINVKSFDNNQSIYLLTEAPTIRAKIAIIA